MHRPLILIVDDESKIRRLLAQNLELEGFDVQTASDGAQALEVYNKSVEKPDLILLDLMTGSFNDNCYRINFCCPLVCCGIKL